MTFCSCSSEEESFPENLIKEELFINIVSEIELTEAYIKLKTAHIDSVDQEILYQNIFEKYAVTKENFNESLVYYSSKPEQLEHIYDQVIVKLSKEEATYQKKSTTD